MKQAPTLLGLVCSFLVACSERPQNSDWIQLFNGEDMYGWETNQAEGSFTIKDGFLVAHSLDLRSHLFYVGDDSEPVAFKNFELIVVAKGDPESNSGIFIHTDYALRDDKGHLANGYEVNLNTSPTVTRKTGSLYDVVDLKEQPLDDTQFQTASRRGQAHPSLARRRKRCRLSGTGKPVRKPNRKGRLLNPKARAIALQAHDPENI